MAAYPLDLSLWIVGPGRAGRALARSWIQAGGKTPTILGRLLETAREAAELAGGGKPMAVGDVSGACCDILVLTVPDDRVGLVAEQMAARLRCRFALHLSGVLSSSILAPLAASGAAVASVHPLRAFAGGASEDWRDAFVAVEGDAAAVEFAIALASALGADGHRLPPHARALYHAGATLAAGGAVAVLSMAVRAWTAAGLPETEARRALAGLTLDAVAAAREREFSEAFTGAVARRDLGTIQAHRDALADLPDVLALYAALAQETLQRTAGRGEEDQIRRMLSVPGAPRR